MRNEECSHRLLSWGRWASVPGNSQLEEDCNSEAVHYRGTTGELQVPTGSTSPGTAPSAPSGVQAHYGMPVKQNGPAAPGSSVEPVRRVGSGTPTRRSDPTPETFIPPSGGFHWWSSTTGTGVMAEHPPIP